MLEALLQGQLVFIVLLIDQDHVLNNHLMGLSSNNDGHYDVLYMNLHTPYVLHKLLQVLFFFQRNSKVIFFMVNLLSIFVVFYVDF